jgi:hypothetical protein
MKVSGQDLIQAIKEQSHLRDLTETEFEGSLYAFPSESKDSPERVMERLLDIETTIAKLQAAQGLYNQKVKVTVSGENLTLAEAVKRIGGLARVEACWRKTAKSGGEDQLYGRRMERPAVADTEFAKKMIEAKVANQKAKETAKTVANLRSAIQAGNTKRVEIEGLDPDCFV